MTFLNTKNVFVVKVVHLTSNDPSENVSAHLSLEAAQDFARRQNINPRTSEQGLVYVVDPVFLDLGSVLEIEEMERVD